jgi:hypothetical protein
MLPSLIRAPVQVRSRVGGNLTAVAGFTSVSVRLEGDQVTSMPWDAMTDLLKDIAGQLGRKSATW